MHYTNAIIPLAAETQALADIFTQYQDTLINLSKNNPLNSRVLDDIIVNAKQHGYTFSSQMACKFLPFVHNFAGTELIEIINKDAGLADRILENISLEALKELDLQTLATIDFKQFSPIALTYLYYWFQGLHEKKYDELSREALKQILLVMDLKEKTDYKIYLAFRINAVEVIKKILIDNIPFNTKDMLGTFINYPEYNLTLLFLERIKSLKDAPPDLVSHAVFCNNDSKVIETLIQKGAPLNNEVYCPLLRALQKEVPDEKVINLLLKYTKLKDISAPILQQIFYFAMLRQNNTIIQKMLELNVKCDPLFYPKTERNSSDVPLLKIALDKNFISIAISLLKNVNMSHLSSNERIQYITILEQSSDKDIKPYLLKIQKDHEDEKTRYLDLFNKINNTFKVENPIILEENDSAKVRLQNSFENMVSGYIDYNSHHQALLDFQLVNSLMVDLDNLLKQIQKNKPELLKEYSAYIQEIVSFMYSNTLNDKERKIFEKGLMEALHYLKENKNLQTRVGQTDSAETFTPVLNASGSEQKSPTGSINQSPSAFFASNPSESTINNASSQLLKLFDKIKVNTPKQT